MFVPQFPPPVVGGLEKQAQHLARSLSDKKIDVYILSGTVSILHRGSDVREGYSVRRIFWPKNKVFRYSILFCSIFFHFFILRNKIEIVHCHQISLGSLWLLFIAKIFKKKTVIKLANVGHYGIPGIKKEVFGGLKIKILKLADCLVAMSMESYKEAIEIGVESKSIFCVSNGVVENNDVFDRPSEYIRVIAVGRLSPEKKIDDLLLAWRQVVQRTKQNVALELYGDGPLLQKLKKQVNDLGIGNSVIFCGHHEDLNLIYKRSSIFVNSSSFEGNSNSILEAMANALPVVASSVGGTPLLVGDEGSNFLFHSGDIAVLSKRLLLLIENRDLREELGKKMRKRVNNHFGINKVALKYICMYEKLLFDPQCDVNSCSDLSLF